MSYYWSDFIWISVNLFFFFFLTYRMCIAIAYYLQWNDTWNLLYIINLKLHREKCFTDVDNSSFFPITNRMYPLSFNLKIEHIMLLHKNNVMIFKFKFFKFHCFGYFVSLFHSYLNGSSGIHCLIKILLDERR